MVRLQFATMMWTTIDCTFLWRLDTICLDGHLSLSISQNLIDTDRWSVFLQIYSRIEESVQMMDMKTRRKKIFIVHHHWAIRHPSSVGVVVEAGHSSVRSVRVKDHDRAIKWDLQTKARHNHSTLYSPSFTLPDIIRSICNLDGVQCRQLQILHQQQQQQQRMIIVYVFGNKLESFSTSVVVVKSTHGVREVSLHRPTIQQTELCALS